MTAPACTHSRVRLDVMKNPDGTCSDRWVCTDCEPNTEFVPRAVLDEARAEMERQAKLLQSAVCAWCGTVTSREPEVMVGHQMTCEKRKDSMERQLRTTEAEVERLRNVVRLAAAAMERMGDHLNELTDGEDGEEIDAVTPAFEAVAQVMWELDPNGRWQPNRAIEHVRGPALVKCPECTRIGPFEVPDFKPGEHFCAQCDLGEGKKVALVRVDEPLPGGSTS